MEKEKISVIITTYNRRNFLEKAINSVFEQTYKNIEIIIIDDCCIYYTTILSLCKEI